MITISIIQKSQLEGASRLDAEYYQPEYLEAKKILLANPHFVLGEHAFITDGEHGSPIFSQSSGIKYFSSQFVNEGFIDSEETNFIDEKINEKNKRTQLKKGNILLSIVGTIGKAGIIREKDLPANTDRNVATIKITDNKILPEFITIFLNSRFGIFQTLREGAGNIQPIIILSKVRNLIIPQFPIEKQKEIVNTFNEFLLLMDKCKDFYSQAENLLLEELGLTDFKIMDDLSFVINFSDIKSVCRTDAEYFQPKYDKLISKLKEKKSKVLSDVMDSRVAKFNPQAEPDKIFRYVELANINSSIGIIDGFSEVLGKEAPSRAKRILKVGDVIVSGVEGSLGKVALVNKEQEGYLASTGFFQFKSEEILPEVLLILSKSIVLKMQLEKQCAGTILAAVPQDALRNIFIPVLSTTSQQKIADLVKKSHEAKKKSKELLEEAKKQVEQMIEGKKDDKYN